MPAPGTYMKRPHSESSLSQDRMSVQLEIYPAVMPALTRRSLFQADWN